MRSIPIILLLALGCTSKKYKQTMLPDGKSWQATVYDIPCPDDKASCRTNIKGQVGTRAKTLCGPEPSRVVTCDIKPTSYGAADADCVIKCGEKVSTEKTANSSLTFEDFED